MAHADDYTGPAAESQDSESGDESCSSSFTDREVPWAELRRRYADSGSQSENEGQDRSKEDGWSNDYDEEYDADEHEIELLSSALRTQGLRDGVVAGGGSRAACQPLKNSMQKLASRVQTGLINCDSAEALEDQRSHPVVANEVRKNDRKHAAKRIRVTDKADRATVDNVLDRRTMVVLLKMLNRDIFSKIAGCVATGKEANVYHAVTSTGSELAIKVYRTSVLTFKDRDRYVTGDFRFRRGYSRHNPRKMVQVWAEKEMRNLTRLSKAGIRCPKPVELKMHILAMDFIGEDARAAPLLKDAKLDADESRKAYCQMLDILWRLYQKCKLVHADLSEFNILHFKDDCYVIDVSQSVDLDHPHALDFLREDCQHVNEFFLKKGVCILTLRELFDFVTDPTVTDNNVQETMAKLIERSESRGLTQGGDVATAVFRRAYIPRRLDDVVDYEADYDKLKKGEDEGIYYQTILGFKKDMSGVSLVPQILEEEAAMQDDVLDPCCTEVNVAQGPTEGGEAGKGDSDREVSGSDSEGSLSAEGREEAQRDATDVRKEKLSKEEMRVVRRENKKAVKEANRVRRESKMPKKLKHKQLKKGKRR